MIDALGRPQSLLLLGGTSEIGTAIAARLLREAGLRLVLAGRAPEALAEAAGRLSDQLPGVVVETIELDADVPEEHRAALEQVFGTGDIDVVVQAVGVLGDQVAAEDDPSVAVQAARTNYVGAMSLTLHAASLLEAQGHGRMVVLSSVAGLRGRRSNYVYGSSKAGLDVLAQGLGDRLAGTGVELLLVRPGFVRTRMTEHLPEAPLATDPASVAEAVATGLARGRRVVYVPPLLGPVMLVLRVLPSPVFRRLDL